MLCKMCKSKIAGGVVTERELYYEGSIAIDTAITDAADIRPGEMVDVLNVNNGARITTYVIAGARNSGTIGLNGPASRFFEKGDPVVILCSCLVSPEERKDWNIKIVKLSKGNRLPSKGG